MQSSVAEKQTENTPQGGSGPEESYVRRSNDRSWRGGEDGERPRGGRGSYRGNRPYDPTRARGSYRGNYRGGNNDSNNNNNAVTNFRDVFMNAQKLSTNNENESSDAVYSQRPNTYRGRGDGSNFRGGRGDYRGRGRGDSTYRGGRGGSRPNHRWEEAKVEEGANIVAEEVIELELDDAQHAIYIKKLDYVRQNMRKMLDDDDVGRICHQCGFDEKRIDDKLAQYKTNQKYAGLEEFEWQTTETKQEKEAAKRKKFEMQERKRLQKERQKELEERRIDREKKQAERDAYRAQKQLEKESIRRQKQEEREARQLARDAKKAEDEAKTKNEEADNDQNEAQTQENAATWNDHETPSGNTPEGVEQSKKEQHIEETSGVNEEKSAKPDRKPREPREKKEPKSGRSGRGRGNKNSQMEYRPKAQTTEAAADSKDFSREDEEDLQEHVHDSNAQNVVTPHQASETVEFAHSKVPHHAKEEEKTLSHKQAVDDVKEQAKHTEAPAQITQPQPVQPQGGLAGLIGGLSGMMLAPMQMPNMIAPQIPGQPQLTPEQQAMVNQSIMMWQQQQIQLLQQQLIHQQMMMQGGNSIQPGAGMPPMMPFNFGPMGFPMAPVQGMQPPSHGPDGKK